MMKAYLAIPLTTLAVGLLMLAGCGSDGGSTAGGFGGTAGVGGAAGVGGIGGGAGAGGGFGGASGAGGAGGASDVAVTGVTLEPASVTLKQGSSEQLLDVVSPKEATNKNVTWSSDDEAVATVSASGLVLGVAAGSTVVTVTTVDGGFSDTTAVTVNPPPNLPTQDFTGVTDGSPLEAFGYTVDDDGSGSPAFEIVDEAIQSETSDLAGWFDFTTPQFEIDRTQGGGVVAQWDVRYPEAIASGDHERSKFYVKLTDADGNTRYRFLYKPYLSPAQAAFNLELASGPTETSLQQVRSRDVDPVFTPTGAAAPWVNFKLELLDTGEVKLLIDDVEFMSTTDTTYTVFHGVTFTYRTDADAKNYTIQLKNLSVLQRT